MSDEIKDDTSIEHYKFLVEHFRKLANDKDCVIKIYRELMEEFKERFERNELLLRSRIRDLENMWDKKKK